MYKCHVLNYTQCTGVTLYMCFELYDTGVSTRLLYTGMTFACKMKSVPLKMMTIINKHTIHSIQNIHREFIA